MSKLLKNPEQGKQFSINFSDNLKTCTKCGKDKELSDYQKTKITKFNKTGLKNHCRDCVQSKVKIWYNKNRKSENIKPIVEGKDEYGNYVITCQKCNTPKLPKFFYKTPLTRANKTGRERNCIECKLIQQRKWAEIHKPAKRKPKKEVTRVKNIDKPITHEPIQGEKWKSMVGFAGKYMVSNMGRIFSIHSKRLVVFSIKKRKEGQKPYYLFRPPGKKDRPIGKKYFSVHRVVAQHFIPNPENKPEINHIKGITTDNRASQLEWATPQENTNHAWRTGLCKSKPPTRKQIIVEASVKTKAVAIYDINMVYVTSVASLIDCAKYLNRSVSTVSYSIKIGKKINKHFVKFDELFRHEPQRLIVKHIPLGE